VPPPFDIIIVGLGAMGSAAALHLARRGKRVLGLDRFAPPHTFGSSHGQTRIIREAYYEHPAYVPLVQRAYVLWNELARATNTELLRPTGGLMIGRRDGVLFAGAKRSATTHHLPCEILGADQIRKRFPALQPDDDMSAVWEPRAGILFPERCIAAHLSEARRHGASLRYDEPVLAWRPDGEGAKVTTGLGEYRAARLVLTAGSWISSLLPEHRLPFAVERQVLYWLDPLRHADRFHPAQLPIHLWQFDGDRFFYGFPDLGEGIKIAGHHQGEQTTPEKVCREVAPSEVESMRAIVRRFLPDADGPLRSATVCLYTNTPDGHFWIDRLADCPQVLVASPCSGHGFKFSSAIGEMVADLITDQKPPFDLDLFRERSK
jgi:sarcosine oxidase